MVTCLYIGVLFWKHPRRKLYAVAQRELRDCRHHGGRRSYSTIDTSDDESDATSSMSATRNKKPKLLETIGDDVLVIRETVTDILPIAIYLWVYNVLFVTLSSVTFAIPFL